MRGIMLALMLLPPALPTAAQETIGLRAGLGSAKMVLAEDVLIGGCPPSGPPNETNPIEACPGLATGWAHSLTFGADLGVPLGDYLDFRVGAALTEKGGAASGRAAGGGTLVGELSAGYLQISWLLRLRTRVHRERRLSVGLLVGPWLAISLWCGNTGAAHGCSAFEREMPDGGFAVGGGVEAKLFSDSSLGVDAIYHRGLEKFGSFATTFLAIQMGFVFPID